MSNFFLSCYVIARLAWKIAGQAAVAASRWIIRHWVGVAFWISIAALAGFMYLFPGPGRFLFACIFGFAILAILFRGAVAASDAIETRSLAEQPHTWHSGKGGKWIPGDEMRLHPLDKGEFSPEEQRRLSAGGRVWITIQEKTPDGEGPEWGVEYESEK